MKNSESMIHPLQKLAGKTALSIPLMLLVSCGVTANPHPPTPPDQPQGVPTYFAVNTGDLPQIYTIDDTRGTFSQEAYLDSPIPQIVSAGEVKIAQRGLHSLGITVSYAFNSVTGLNQQTNYPNPKFDSFAVELADQTGGLVQLVGQPVTPQVAATQCPGQKTQTYQFITIAAPVAPPTPSQAASWNPATDTAYGSVDISASDTAVTFQNIRQFTLRPVGGSGAPQQPAASSLTGACGSTAFGYLPSVPGQLILIDPNTNNKTVPPQASIGINPAGLLVEDNGVRAGGATLPHTSPPLLYNNILGAGAGAVGLPKPSGQVDTGSLIGAQYLGFIYTPSSNGLPSHLASFGFAGSPPLPPACSSFAAQIGPLTNGIYGGDFTNDDPSTSQDGFGNCDFAVDLGAQDTSMNGVYPNATVWVGSGYATNPTGPTYSFKAVAIAGPINGKNAIFLVGAEQNSTQSWGIYLLQSN